MKYDYLIVGSGLFGCVFAREAQKKGKRCLVIEKRDHPGGNIYTEQKEEITVHKYGPHIFHTSNKKVWDYVNQFSEFNRFTNSPIAFYKNELYNLPFNMNTFNKIWGVVSPGEAMQRIAEQIKADNAQQEPQNLEEKAISLVGKDIYEKLVKGYTEKQWGKSCRDLPAFIIGRLPVRFTYDNNYYSDLYQGVPMGGYTKIIQKMLNGIEVSLHTDFSSGKNLFLNSAKKIVYTGMVDEFYDYCFGELEYRSLKFEHEALDIPNYQGNAVVNYTDPEVPYTRIIEHKHFEFGSQLKTVITKEYPVKWEKGCEPFYPVNDHRNNEMFARYKELAEKETRVIFGGRLADYRYYDMDQVVGKALLAADEI